MTRVRRSDRPPFLSPRTPLPGGPVSRFNNLRLAYRLGIAFGVVILALVVIGAISVTKLGTLSNEAETMSTHDVVSMQRVLTIEHRLQTTAYLATTHLYVHDGDLSAQDRIAKQADALAAADAADLKALDTSIDPGSRSLLGKYKAGVAQFATTSGTAIRRSRAVPPAARRGDPPPARRARPPRRGPRRLARLLQLDRDPRRGRRLEGR